MTNNLRIVTREITQEEKEKALREIGLRVIEKAIGTEGLVIASELNIIIKRNEASLWVKKNAHEFHVDENVLYAILVELLKRLAKDEIDKM